MALSNTITKEQFEGLPEPLREHYKVSSDGNGFELQHDGVRKLKDSLDEKDRKLAERDRRVAEQQAIIDKFRDLDPEKAREALEKLESMEREELISKGDYDAAMQKERDAAAAREKKVKDELDDERGFTSRQLVDGVLDRVLRTGGKGEGGDVPRVLDGLVDGAKALILRDHRPEVKRGADGERVAVVKVDGVDRPLEEFLIGWLSGDGAKSYTEAPDNAGGHGDRTRPGSGGGSTRTVRSTDKAALGASIEDIASGKVTVTD